jgi:hypothetical protein
LDRKLVTGLKKQASLPVQLWLSLCCLLQSKICIPRFCHPPRKVKFFFDVYDVEKGCDQLSPDLTLGHAGPLTVRVE